LVALFLKALIPQKILLLLVEEIVKGNVEKAVPKVVNEALEWEEIE
jgi:hypothetical protein